MNLYKAEVLGRLGGDEFVVVLPSTPEALARQVAARLSAAVSEIQLYFNGKRIDLGISYGTATYSGGEPDFAHLVQSADARLYEMKRRRELLPSGVDATAKF